jgi:hypothetical protein
VSLGVEFKQQAHTLLYFFLAINKKVFYEETQEFTKQNHYTKLLKQKSNKVSNSSKAKQISKAHIQIFLAC